jgi:putative membrane protein insertion efficiency factor
MKKILLITISIYQNLFSFVLKGLTGVNECCRFSPTCSQYAKEAISQDGAILGTYKTLIRVLKCQPFYNKAI